LLWSLDYIFLSDIEVIEKVKIFFNSNLNVYIEQSKCNFNLITYDQIYIHPVCKYIKGSNWVCSLKWVKFLICSMFKVWHYNIHPWWRVLKHILNLLPIVFYLIIKKLTGISILHKKTSEILKSLSGLSLEYMWSKEEIHVVHLWKWNIKNFIHV